MPNNISNKLFVQADFSGLFDNKGYPLHYTEDNFSLYDCILTPINFNDVHWCLVYISIKNGKLIFIDPKGENDNVFENLFQNWW